jgi:hypothetical protein
MQSPIVRASLCLLLGFVPGSVFGLLFAPDPTGLAPFGIAVVVTLPVAGYLYWSGWLRDERQTQH